MINLEQIATRNFGKKERLVFILLILFLTDLAIFLDIQFLRQIFGFLFLTILPGLLILQILKLDRLEFTEKFVLSVGLSITFLMLFGVLINNLSLSLGYETPLATIPLLIEFSGIFIILAIVGYKRNKKNIAYSLPNLNLTTTEKAFLIVPVLFPALSIFGMRVMNTADNNIILMFLLFLIPIYVVFVCVFNQKFPKRLYPVVIFLIGISLLLLLSLRSNHIIGVDVHFEYYLFFNTLSSRCWHILGHTALNTCLVISILPTIYQSILNIAPEFLFKILYSLIFSISPLVIYIISKKYVGESYAFLASCFFMFQHTFLQTEYNARTNIAILFFALAMMVLFNDRIDSIKKRILYILFIVSCIVSHYSTAYIFFFLMVGCLIGMEVLSTRYSFKKELTLTNVFLFFAMIFFWYSQVTKSAFTISIKFFRNTVSSFNQFFIEESRGGYTQAIFGEAIMQKGIPHKIEFVLTWLMFAFIGIGVIALLIRYKEMSFEELKFKKPDFLEEKFDVLYLVISLACAGLVVAIVAFPYVGVVYSVNRTYTFALVVLSVFFVVGGIVLTKHFFFFTKRKSVLKEKQKSVIKKKALPKKQNEWRKALKNPARKIVEGERCSQVRAYLIILLVLIPYFFCVTGVTYQMFGYSREITLNSEGKCYDDLYVYDQECYGAKWLKSHFNEKIGTIYVDKYGYNRLFSQAAIYLPGHVRQIKEGEGFKKGYIYLRYTGVVKGKLLGMSNRYSNITNYPYIFIANSKIYANGGSEIYRCVGQQ